MIRITGDTHRADAAADRQREPDRRDLRQGGAGDPGGSIGRRRGSAPRPIGSAVWKPQAAPWRSQFPFRLSRLQERSQACDFLRNRISLGALIQTPGGSLVSPTPPDRLAVWPQLSLGLFFASLPRHGRKLVDPPAYQTPYMPRGGGPCRQARSRLIRCRAGRSASVLIWLVALVAIGTAVWWWRHRPRTPETPRLRPRGTAVEIVYATGAVEPVRWAKVTPGRAASSSRCDCEGRRSPSGDVLVRLDDREARAQLHELEAREDFASAKSGA